MLTVSEFLLKLSFKICEKKYCHVLFAGVPNFVNILNVSYWKLIYYDP